MRPLAQADGGEALRLFDEVVRGGAPVIDDSVAGCKDVYEGRVSGRKCQTFSTGFSPGLIRGGACVRQRQERDIGGDGKRRRGAQATWHEISARCAASAASRCVPPAQITAKAKSLRTRAASPLRRAKAWNSNAEKTPRSPSAEPIANLPQFPTVNHRKASNGIPGVSKTW